MRLNPHYRLMKIYVASSWKNEFFDSFVGLLLNHGYEVYNFRNPEESKAFSWDDIDPNWQNWSIPQFRHALSHPIARAGFESDFNAMKNADCCVLVLPCGRSAHSEAGWMKGAGKPVFVVSPIPQEPELMYGPYDRICESPYDLIKALELTAALSRVDEVTANSSLAIAPTPEVLQALKDKDRVRRMDFAVVDNAYGRTYELIIVSHCGSTHKLAHFRVETLVRMAEDWLINNR